MSNVKVLNSYLPADNLITSDPKNKAYATVPNGYKRVKSVSNEVAKAVRPLLKLDYGWLTPIIETTDNGEENHYLARIEPHYHPPSVSNKKWHLGVSVFLSNDSPRLLDTVPDNKVPKQDLLADNKSDKVDTKEKSSFVKKLDEFLDKMLG